MELYHFDLAPIEFRDALALRYLRTPPGLPSRCDGCGESFTLQLGLDCPKGGLIIQRYNEIRDCLGDMAVLVWLQGIREPVVQEDDPASDIDIIHGTGLETNHVCQLVVYILYSAMRVWDRFMYSAISQEN